MAKISMPAVNAWLVKALGQVVAMLPRGTNPATKEQYRGVLQRDVATAFYAVMRKHEVPLADVVNEDCTYEKPCGKCRRCVLQVTSEAAEAEGTVVRVPRGKDVRNEKTGRIERRTWVTYYSPGEIKTSKSFDEIAEKVIAALS